MKRRISLFFVFCLMLTLIPVNHAYAIEIDGQVYNNNDFYKMQSFLKQPSATGGLTNAQALGWDEANPTTWGGVEWNDAFPKRIKGIEFFFFVAGDLDVSDFSHLELLTCFFNALKSINASGAVSLTEFYCYESALESLDISGATSLTSVSSTFGQLRSLDVSGASSLEEIICNNNQLKSLDVSGLEKLVTLNCNYNQLESLNLGGKSALVYLACNNNHLKELDVSQNPALYYLSTVNNRLKLIKAHSAGSQITAEVRGNGYIELWIELSTAFALVKPMSGAAFVGWSGYDEESSRFPLALGETDYDLTADFSLWNVAFDKNGGDSDAVPSSMSVSHEGQLESLPAEPALSGYSFGGWYKEAECANAWDFDNDSVIADTTLFAKWIAQEADLPIPEPTPEPPATPAPTVTPPPATPAPIVKPAPPAIPAPTVTPEPLATPAPTVTQEPPVTSTPKETPTLYIPKEPVPMAGMSTKNVLSISPQNGIICVGERFCLEPSVTGGSWEYDASYLQHGSGVFTALKAGTTRITYTDGSQSAYADIVISPALLPTTGQSFALIWVLLALGLCTGVASLLSIRRRRGHYV